MTASGRSNRRRVTAAIVTGAVVLAGAATAAAVVGRNRSDRAVRVTSERTTSIPSTSESAASTSTSAPTTTTPAAATSLVVDDSTTTLPPIDAEAADLQATLTLATPRLFAEVPNTYSLTVRNVSDHAVAFSADRQLGVWVQAGSAGGFPVHEVEVMLNAGEQRTFTSEITPAADMVGFALVSAAVLRVNRASVGPPFITYAIGPVPYLESMVVPPNYVEGQPLDPALGRWAAILSADSETVAVGAPVAVHATLRNIGDQAQLTKGFGALAVVCFGVDRGPIVAEWGQYVDAATLAPGEQQTFTIEFRPTSAFLDKGSGHTSCMVGVGYHDDRDHIAPLENRNPPAEADSSLVYLTVLPAEAPTSSTTP